MRRTLAIRLVIFTLVAAGCNSVLGIEEASDPAGPGSGGGGGRAGGAAGSSSPAGAGGSGDAAGAGGGAGAPGGAGGAPSGVALLGTPCVERGARACNKPADKLVLVCSGTPLQWATAEVCDGTKLCDGRSPDVAPTTSGSCQEVVPACAGQPPGAVVCEGAVRHVCGPDLVTSATTTCPTAQLCQLGVAGPGCAVCQTGEHACAGSLLRKCAADHQSFVDVDDCGAAELCNPGAGQCTAEVCVDGQHRCNGDALEVCNASRSGFDPKQACSPGLCDVAGQQCDVCVPTAKRCLDGANFGVCAGDGQSETTGACPSGTAFCVGQGQCVQCVTASNCPQPTGVCKVATCSGGACDVANAPDGKPCGADKICSGGFCVCPGFDLVAGEPAPGADAAICPQPP